MISSAKLKEISTQVRPIIERQIDDAVLLASIRDMVSSLGGDWSALKALIKAQVQDEKDGGERVAKRMAKAECSTEYASLLGLNMNEENYIRDAAE